MKLKGIKEVTQYNKDGKSLDVIRTTDSDMLFSMEQVIELIDARKTLNRPDVLFENAISLDVNTFLDLLEDDAKVYNERGDVIEDRPERIFWFNIENDNMTKPVIFTDKRSFENAIFNLKDIHWEYFTDWLDEIETNDGYSKKEDHDINGTKDDDIINIIKESNAELKQQIKYLENKINDLIEINDMC